MPLEKKLGLPTREAYGKALVELGRKNPNIVVFDADLSKSTKTALFGKEFPDRFFNMGIQEANMVGVAGGLAAQGKIAFVSSFACFVMCKGYDQLRMAVAFPQRNVKVVASHGGISVGEDGPSQQSIEDIALATSLPGFVVMVPADEFAAREFVFLAAEHPGPIYLRMGRPKAPMIYGPNSKFEIGKAVRLREGRDVTLVANGLLVFEALLAAESLEKKGLSASVIDMHTVKPIDREMLIEEAEKTRAVVTCEEHQIWGGLGSAVAKCLGETSPTPMEFIAIQDTYAESGKPEELFDRYGLSAAHIVRGTERLLERTKGIKR